MSHKRSPQDDPDTHDYIRCYCQTCQREFNAQLPLLPCEISYSDVKDIGPLICPHCNRDIQEDRLPNNRIKA